MGFLSGIFGGGKNPANAAMPYLNQIPGVAQQNLGPWQQQGQQQAQQNQGTYAQMVQDPAAFHAALRATYSPSEGYKFKEKNYLKAASGAAAAGGQRGSQADQEAQTRLVQGLLGEDEGAYLDRLYNVLGTGLQGNEMGAQRGFGAAGDMANILASNLSQQGGLAYRGQENQNAQNEATRKFLMQAIGAGLGAFGGPAGMAAGAGMAGGSMGGKAASSVSNALGGFKPTNSQIFGQYLYGMGK